MRLSDFGGNSSVSNSTSSVASIYAAFAVPATIGNPSFSRES